MEKNDATHKTRKQQAIETKQKIFEATMSLAREKGIESVQIEEISKRANVSMGLFYKYFANKSDVITESIIQSSNAYYNNIIETKLGGLRGKEKIMTFAGYVAKYHQNELSKEDLRRNYSTILAYSSRGQSITNELRPIYTLLFDALEEMVRDMELPSDISIKDEARHIAMIMRGTVFEYLLSDDSQMFDIYENSMNLIKTYINGLKYGEKK